MSKPAFDFYEAFSRNIGFVTPDELFVLRSKKVAIAGMGGVGGNHLLTLVRLGIGQFHIADLDTFELANFNRQAGSNIHSLSKEKVRVMADQAKLINPELEIREFREGVHDGNINDFLEGVDLYVDGLDFFSLEIRQKIFMACHRRGIPCITVGPIGSGFTMISFLPGGMSFDDYWKLKGVSSRKERLLRFASGLVPSIIHGCSLVSRRAFDFEHGRVASTPMGCYFATAMMGTEALKILLKRGKVLSAPNSIQFDGYSYRMKKNYLWWGTNNPILRLKHQIGKWLGVYG